MKSEALISAVKDLKPIIVLSGDGYISGRALDYVKRKLVPDADFRDANLTTYEGKAPAAPVVKMCRTSPVFANRRLVCLVDFSDLNGLVEYVSSPCITTILVIVCDKIDARTKFATAIKKRGVVIHFDTPKEHELGRWLLGEAQAQKIPITQDACDLIVQVVGNELPLLMDSLERCHLSAPRGARVESEHVTRALALSRKFGVFDLTDACVARDLSRAFSVLENLLINREEPIRLERLLEGSIKKLVLCVGLIAEGVRSDDVPSALGVHPYVAGKLYQQARRLDVKRADKMHEIMFRLALECAPGTKARGLSAVGDRFYLERAVMEICNV